MAEKRKMNKFIVPIVGIIFVFVVFILLKGNREKYTAIKTLPPKESENKREDGDTQTDTIRALQAYAKEAVEKAKKLNEKTITQSKQVEENKNTVSSLERENQKNKEELDETKMYAKALETKLKELNRKIDVIVEEKNKEPTEIPVGFGFDNESEQSKNSQGKWYNPIDLVENTEGETSTGFKGLLGHPAKFRESATTQNKVVQESRSSQAETVKPYFTLPKDAILFDSLAFTALIGRIPVDGVTPDPYPVKIFIGKENLLANGFDIPEVEGMIFSGLGIGDWNLSCVSARLYSATFIFEGGTIVNQTESEPLAYISDRTGVPCVSGRFVSNARQFITQQAALSGFGAAGSAYSSAQLETSENNVGDRSTSLVGDISKVIAGNIVKTSTDEVSNWLLARQKQSFEAVVVDPGQQVSIHLEKSIIIDQKEFARKVRYVRLPKTTENTLD